MVMMMTGYLALDDVLVLSIGQVPEQILFKYYPFILDEHIIYPFYLASPSILIICCIKFDINFGIGYIYIKGASMYVMVVSVDVEPPTSTSMIALYIHYISVCIMQ